MKCYNPRLAFVNPQGGRPIFTQYRWAQFIHWKGNHQAPKFLGKFDGNEALKMPCGKCEACRLEQARQKAVRCVHELKTHDGVGAFLTLTYAPEFLPEGGSYDESDIVGFVKRLRERICTSVGCKGERFNWNTYRMSRTCRGFCPKIKTFGCAEYGRKGLRPHFHLLVFGFDFPDREYWRGSSQHGSGSVAFRSKLLEETWGKGHCELGTLTFASASYTARYTQKKSKRLLPEHLKPEKSVCVPRRRGLGKEFFEKFKDDIYAIDSVVVSGKRQGVPRYYDKLLQNSDPEKYEKIKLARLAKRPQDEFHNSQERMAVRKECHQQSIKKLRRQYEDEAV